MSRRTAKNSTRVADLSETQLIFLNDRIQKGMCVHFSYYTFTKPWTLDITVVKNGQTKDKSREHCYRSSLPLTRQGYPKSLRLGKKNLEPGQNFGVNKPEEYNWPPTHIVLMFNGEFPPSTTAEASHLCNHTWCVRKRHLRWEEPKANYARKNCNTWTQCPCPCNNKFNPCKHNPQCLSMRKCNCNVHRTIRQGAVL